VGGFSSQLFFGFDAAKCANIHGHPHDY